MKCHDWIFLMFTTIICCMATISIAQAQQRGRVKFNLPATPKDDSKLDSSSVVTPRASQVRASVPRASNRRGTTSSPVVLQSSTVENKQTPRSRGVRTRSNVQSPRKLDVEATNIVPSFRLKKQAEPTPEKEEPLQVQASPVNNDRANVIRRGRSRQATATTNAPSTSSLSPQFRKRSDVSTEEATRSVRKLSSRSLSNQEEELTSSEVPSVIATTKSNWRSTSIRRGTAKAKVNERKPKTLEDQLEDENYPEHFKILLKKQLPNAPQTERSLRRPPEAIYANSNEVYDVTKSPDRLRRLEQSSQENSDEILQVSRAIPKARKVEPKREDNARATYKSRRASTLKEETTTQINLDDVVKAPLKSDRVEPSSEKVEKIDLKSTRNSVVQVQSAGKILDNNGASFKTRRTETQFEGAKRPSKSSRPLFLPRKSESYRQRAATTTTARSTTASKPNRTPEELRAKYKYRAGARLPFPSIKTKTTTTTEQSVNEDNEIGNLNPSSQATRPLQITKSRNLTMDRPLADTRHESKPQKFSSRFRGDAYSRYHQKTEQSKPNYTPTIPAVTTEPIAQQSDLPPSRKGKSIKPYNPESHDPINPDVEYTGVVFDEKAGVWNMVEPIAGGLTRSQIIVDSADEHSLQSSSSVTVSIFEALADILSKTPTTTTTTTTTTSTTTSTTELPEIIQVPELKIDTMQNPSTTVNTHLMSDVDDDYATTNEIMNIDRNGRILNSVDNEQTSTTNPNPSKTISFDLSELLRTVQPNTENTTQTEHTTLLTDLLDIALPTDSNFISDTLTNATTNTLELTTLPSIPPTNLPLPFLSNALTTPGSSLITRPQLISAISNFLDTSVQNASETMATNTTTTATLDTDTEQFAESTTSATDASATFSPTTSFPSTESPPVTISFLDIFTIQPKKVNQNTEPVIDVHPIYKEPDANTTPSGRKQKNFIVQTTGRPVNINTFFRTQTYPSIAISGGTSTDHIRELSSNFQGFVTDGDTIDTSTTSYFEYTSPQPSARTQSLPIHLNSILGSTQKYDQTSPSKTTQTTETTTTVRSRFGNNRLPILPAGFIRNSTTKSTTTTPSTIPSTTSTENVARASSPKQQLSTSTSQTSTEQQEPKLIKDFSVYGILPNNTVIRKRPVEASRTLDIGVVVYGILPNQTVVRKYPNGTLAIVDSTQDVEVVNIDPKMLFNPFSELYRTSQSSLLLTTHRSTAPNGLIENNNIVGPNSRTEATVNTATNRRGNGIKDTTDSGRIDASTSNGDDENLILLLNENEDNLLNSTSLVEANTENAVLLDLLKRKYINADIQSRSSNVVSLTTAKNVIEENSIQPNREENVSENSLLDSSEEKKKDISSSTSSEEDLLAKLFPANGSAAPKPSNADDENVISHRFETFANVGRGSIFAGNKGRALEFSQRTKLYPIKLVLAGQNTTTKLFPIHTNLSATSSNDTHAVSQNSFVEVNPTGDVVMSPAVVEFTTITPVRDGTSKIIDLGILESEIDSEATGDYFMDPDDRKGVHHQESLECSGDVRQVMHSLIDEGSGDDREFIDLTKTDGSGNDDDLMQTTTKSTDLENAEFWTNPPGSIPVKIVYAHDFDELDDVGRSKTLFTLDTNKDGKPTSNQKSFVQGSKNLPPFKLTSSVSAVRTTFSKSSFEPKIFEENVTITPDSSTVTPSSLELGYTVPVQVLYPDNYFEELEEYLENSISKNHSNSTIFVPDNSSLSLGDSNVFKQNSSVESVNKTSFENDFPSSDSFEDSNKPLKELNKKERDPVTAQNYSISGFQGQDELSVMPSLDENVPSANTQIQNKSHTSSYPDEVMVNLETNRKTEPEEHYLLKSDSEMISDSDNPGNTDAGINSSEDENLQEKIKTVAKIEAFEQLSDKNAILGSLFQPNVENKTLELYVAAGISNETSFEASVEDSQAQYVKHLISSNNESLDLSPINETSEIFRDSNLESVITDIFNEAKDKNDSNTSHQSENVSPSPSPDASDGLSEFGSNSDLKTAISEEKVNDDFDHTLLSDELARESLLSVTSNMTETTTEINSLKHDLLAELKDENSSYSSQDNDSGVSTLQNRTLPDFDQAKGAKDLLLTIENDTETNRETSYYQVRENITTPLLSGNSSIADITTPQTESLSGSRNRTEASSVNILPSDQDDLRDGPNSTEFNLNATLIQSILSKNSNDELNLFEDKEDLNHLKSISLDNETKTFSKSGSEGDLAHNQSLSSTSNSDNDNASMRFESLGQTFDNLTSNLQLNDELEFGSNGNDSFLELHTETSAYEPDQNLSSNFSDIVLYKSHQDLSKANFEQSQNAFNLGKDKIHYMFENESFAEAGQNSEPVLTTSTPTSEIFLNSANSQVPDVDAENLTFTTSTPTSDLFLNSTYSQFSDIDAENLTLQPDLKFEQKFSENAENMNTNRAESHLSNLTLQPDLRFEPKISENAENLNANRAGSHLSSSVFPNSESFLQNSKPSIDSLDENFDPTLQSNVTADTNFAGDTLLEEQLKNVEKFKFLVPLTTENSQLEVSTDFKNQSTVTNQIRHSADLNSNGESILEEQQKLRNVETFKFSEQSSTESTQLDVPSDEENRSPDSLYEHSNLTSQTNVTNPTRHSVDSKLKVESNLEEQQKLRKFEISEIPEHSTTESSQLEVPADEISYPEVFETPIPIMDMVSHHVVEVITTTQNPQSISIFPSRSQVLTSFSPAESTKPPAIYYPMNMQSTTKTTQEVKAATIMPINMRAVPDASTESRGIMMVFPKNSLPKINEALPGHFGQMYTEDAQRQTESSKKWVSGETDETASKPKLKIGEPMSIKAYDMYNRQSVIDSPSHSEEISVSSLVYTSDLAATTLAPKFDANKVHTTLARPSYSQIPIEPSKTVNSFENSYATTEQIFVPGGVPQEMLLTTEALSSQTTFEPESFIEQKGTTSTSEVNGNSTYIAALSIENTTPNVLNSYQTTLNMLGSNLGNEKDHQDSSLNSLDIPVTEHPEVDKNFPRKSELSPENLSSKELNSVIVFKEVGKTENSPQQTAPTSNLHNENTKSSDRTSYVEKERVIYDQKVKVDKAARILDSDNDFKTDPTQNAIITPLLHHPTALLKNAPQKQMRRLNTESNFVYQMSENAVANMQTLNTTMSAESSNISLSKFNPPITSLSEELNASDEPSDSNSIEDQYSTTNITQIPQQQSKIDVESWTKNTPPELIYAPMNFENNSKDQKQQHTETQYTIQQHNYFQESSTISSIDNTILIDNLKNSPNTITEPKRVDNIPKTPTIFVVTPAPAMPTTTTSTTPPTTTTTSTTPSTTTSTTTTPSTTTSTTTSTTPSTTTTTSTTSTTSTTPATTTTTTTETPTTSTTPLTTTTFSTTRVSLQTTSEATATLASVNSELEKNIKLLEQLLALQSGYKSKSSSSSSSSTKTTTTSTRPPPTTTVATTIAAAKPTSDADDIKFLNTLRQLLLSQQQATKKPNKQPITTSTTTTTPRTTTTSTTIKPITISPQNLQDLLNSFSTPSFTTTTERPRNQEDLDFLNSLRDIGKIPVTTSTPPTFSNRIIELALQNRPITPTSPVYIPARISTTTPAFAPMPPTKRPALLPANEFERHRQDQASLSADLSLLSTLLGRKITVADLPQITQQYGGNRKPSTAPKDTTTTTTTQRATTTTSPKPMTRDEIAEIQKNLQLLSSLLGRPVTLNELPLIMQDLRSGRKPKGTSSAAQSNLIKPGPSKFTATTTRSKTTLFTPSQTPISQEEVIELLKDPAIDSSPDQLNLYGKTNDAVLAAVLKQRGIGPTHNNIPVNDLFFQGPTPMPYRTTRPPPPPRPQPTQRRPLLDGLAWLWKAWQDTAPGTRVSRNNRQPTASASTRLESPLVVGAFGDTQPTGNSGDGGEYADLQYPQNPASFGQGNGLLTAAFSVTKAVTQFLGAAFQGAAKSVQTAFSPQAVQTQNGLIGLSG